MKARYLIIAIFAAGFFVYFNCLFNNFVWDDEEQIVKNAVIQNPANLSYLFRSGTFYGGGAGLSGWFYRPLVTLSYMVNFRIWKLNPFGYHLFQLILHLINASLIFLIFSELYRKETKAEKSSPFFAFLMAIIFAIHPAITEGVAYIASVGEVLYTFFALSALLLILAVPRFARPPLAKAATAAFPLSIFFALLSKEAAMSIVPIIWFYLFLFRRSKQALPWVVTSLGVIFFYLYIRLGVVGLPISHPRYALIAEASLSARLLTVPYELFSYIKLFFFPKDLAISQHLVVTQLSDFRFWGLALVLLILFFVALWLFKTTSSKVLLFSFFWFLISIGLVLNIFPLDMTIAERWFYFPFIGLLGVFGVAAREVSKSKVFKNPSVIATIFSIWLLFLGGRTIVRNVDWRDGLTLYSHDIKYSQPSFDLENNLGVELFRVGRYEEAKKHFERSIALQPKWWFAHNNLGAVYQREGDLKKARELYERSIGLADYYLAYENLAYLLLKVEEPSKASEFIKEALTKFPRNGKLQAALAVSYYQNKDYEMAKSAVRKAYILEPSPQNRSILEAIINRREIEF